MDKTAEARQLVEQLLSEKKEPTGPFHIDVDVVGPDAEKHARMLAVSFKLQYQAEGPNGNPVVIGSLAAKEQVENFASHYCPKCTVAYEARKGGGTDVFFE